jgi:cyclase
MLRFRVIPILLLKNSGLYKSINFENYKYIGDPINAIRIFNEKEVDELVLLDINATIHNREPDTNMLKLIVSECYMPLSFGGGICNTNMIKEILNIGVEKIIINTAAIENPNFIREAVKLFGSSTIVISIDAKRNFLNNYSVYVRGGKEKTKKNPIEWAKECENMGVGEIIINSIDNDGCMNGYDWKLIKGVSDSVSIPVIASGGASSIHDFNKAINECKVSAVSAGSYFVFHGKHRAVLISYPSRLELDSLNKFN